MALVDGTNCGFVTARPTEDPAATAATTDNYVMACEFTSPAGSNNLTEVGFWVNNETEEANYQVGIYEHDGVDDEPGALLATSGDLTKALNQTGWIYGTVNYSLAAETVYWLAIQLDNTATATTTDYSASAVYRTNYQVAAALPSPWGDSTGSLGRIWSIYGLYEEAGGGLSIPIAMYHYRHH